MFFLKRAERIRNEARAAWHVADDAWEAELVREFGHDAPARRYQVAGRSTPRLERLYLAAETARMAYIEAERALNALLEMPRKAA